MITTLRLGQSSRRARGVQAVLLWPLRLLTTLAYRYLSTVFNCSVPFGVAIGRRVRWQHGFSGIFVTRDAKIGDDCIILHQVTIGSNLGAATERRATPVIGNGVLIGAGAKIIGGVSIGDGAKIGAQALVVSDVPAGATCLAPPARVVVAAETSSDG
jgi:serine O-acetyltransferase